MTEEHHKTSIDVSSIHNFYETSEDSSEDRQPLIPEAELGMFSEPPRWQSEKKLQNSQTHIRMAIYIISGVVTILLTMLMTAIIIWCSIKPHTHGKGHKNQEIASVPLSMDEETWLSCGETPQEARAAGCVFDLMLSSWVHPYCHNRTYMDLHVANVQFPWYRDKELTEPVYEEEVRLGEYDTLYCYQDFHYEHCMYMWRIQIRAWKEGLPIDAGSWNMGHSEHCAQLMLDPKLEYPK